MRSFTSLIPALALALAVAGCVVGPGNGNQNGNSSANTNGNTGGGNANDNGSTGNDNSGTDVTLAGTWTTDGEEVATGATIVAAIHFTDDNELTEYSIPRTTNGTFDAAEVVIDGQEITILFDGAGGPEFVGVVGATGNFMTGQLDADVVLGDSGVIIPAGPTVFARETGGGNENDNANTNANDNSGDNSNDNDSVELVELAPMTFLGDVLAGVDPVSFEIGGGSVDFAGGEGRTLGIGPLYSSDFLSWVAKPGAGTITFTDLDVRVVSFYLADLGEPGASLTAFDTDGAEIDTVDSFQAAIFADPQAMFTIDGGGKTIARLVITTPTGVTVALDDLALTVAE